MVPLWEPLLRLSGRLVRVEREIARDYSSAAALVDDVHRIVLAVRARDAEEKREPAEEAEPPLLGEAAPEHQGVAVEVEVRSGLLRDAVYEDLEGPADLRRKRHSRSLLRGGDHLRRMPPRALAASRHPRFSRGHRAHYGRRCRRGQGRILPGRAPIAEREPDRDDLLADLRLHRRDLPVGGDLARRLHPALSQPWPPTRGRGPADPRPHEDRARVEDRKSVV